MNTMYGRVMLGLSAILFGVIAFFGHDFNVWEQLQTLWGLPLGWVVGGLVGIAQIVGGIAIILPQTQRIGATILGATYAFFAVICIPKIITQPAVFARYGNFFEEFSILCGIAALLDMKWARVAFGVCVVSFTLNQAFYLPETAQFVPPWVPPNAMFWAIATTVFFGLAAVALLFNLKAKLAAQLTTVMIVLFGLMVWVPMLIAHPQASLNWGGIAQNFLIGGAAWIVAGQDSAS